MAKPLPKRKDGETDAAYIERCFAALYGVSKQRLKPVKPQHAKDGA